MTGFPGISPHKVPLWCWTSKRPDKLCFHWSWMQVSGVDYDGKRRTRYKILFQASSN